MRPWSILCLFNPYIHIYVNIHPSASALATVALQRAALQTAQMSLRLEISRAKNSENHVTYTSPLHLDWWGAFQFLLTSEDINVC